MNPARFKKNPDNCKVCIECGLHVTKEINIINT